MCFSKLKNHKTKYQKYLLVIFCLTASFSAKTQPFPYALSLGTAIHFGTHIQRAGVIVSGYYIYKSVQLNGRAGGGFYLKTPGPKGKGIEGIFSLGAVGLWGKDSVESGLFLHQVSNQSNKPHSIGYSFNLYGDMKKTSQRTGTLGMQFRNFELLHENDFLGNLKSDRYRTSAFLIAYRQNNVRVAITSMLWTGNTNSVGARNIEDASVARFGYIDMTNTEYGDISHGTLAAQVDYVFHKYRTVRAAMGIDAEQIRNLLQNKFAHDSWYLPKKWNRKHNYHVPMVDSKGGMYLYRTGQKVRRPKLFADFSLDPWLFY